MSEPELAQLADAIHIRSRVRPFSRFSGRGFRTTDIIRNVPSN